MRVCALIPVYDHAATLRDVAGRAARHLPVIVVDDGSTDGGPDTLAGEPGVELVRHPRNLGKGAALMTGFRRARALGYTHALTLDADGQHAPEDIPAVLTALAESPTACVLGHRDLGAARAPALRRVVNAAARLGVWAVTGAPVRDALTGFRVVPLALLDTLTPRAGRYAFELELLVLARWSGVPVREVPVRVDYALPTSRRSHVRPRSLDALALLGLVAEAWLLPRALRLALRRPALAALPFGQRVRAAWESGA